MDSDEQNLAISRRQRLLHSQADEGDDLETLEHGISSSSRLSYPRRNLWSEVARVEQMTIMNEHRRARKPKFLQFAKRVRNALAWIRKVKKSASEQKTQDSFLQKFTATTEYNIPETAVCFESYGRLEKAIVVDPTAHVYYRWLLVVSIAVIYNTITIIGRSVFWELQNVCPNAWFFFDYVCDAIYLIDIVVQSQTGYLEEGLLVRDRKKLLKNYTRSANFKLDVMSLLPTDMLYLCLGTDCNSKMPCFVILRINRLFRFSRMSEFFDRTETRTNLPCAFRVAKLILYILVIIHWNACFYFAMSYVIGFGTDEWVYGNVTHPSYSSLTHQYIYSFYWSTLTLTTIGGVPVPKRNIEYLFVVVDFLVGVLVFATIVGNVGSMITSMNAARSEFQNKIDNIKQYLEFRHVNKELENKVIKWFEYLWNNKQSLDENAVTATLPDKLKAEIAIHVHLDTLKRVRIFQDCEPGLLVQLVLRLKLQVFSPGDYICRKGDVGKEMYIVKRGRLNVVGDDGKTVFATLCDGSVFGELSILNISGMKTGNRRTANVRSVGYSDLFVLSKRDLLEVLEEYPEAQNLLIERGKQILLKDGLLDEEAMNSYDNERETLKCNLNRLENMIDLFEARFSSFFGEYILAQQTVQERICNLEKRVRDSLKQRTTKYLGKSTEDTESDEDEYL